MKKIIILILVIIFIFVGCYFFKPQTEEVYVNAVKEEKGMKVTLLGGTNTSSMGSLNSMGYVIRSKSGKLIIVDGGRKEDAGLVLEYIQKYGNNGKVDAWFITHPHTDHLGAMVELVEREENITIENIYYSLNELEWYEKYDTRGYEFEKETFEALKSSKIINQVQVQKGMNFQIDNIECEIIRIANPKVTASDNGNDSSMCFKLTAKDVNKSMIFLGDSFNYASKELLEEKEKLKADAVQMSHHGQNGVTLEVYEAINPKICFYNTTESIYNNDIGGGYNTGPYKTMPVREKAEALGAKSYMAFNGDQTIAFTEEGFEEIAEKSNQE